MSPCRVCCASERSRVAACAPRSVEALVSQVTGQVEAQNGMAHCEQLPHIFVAYPCRIPSLEATLSKLRSWHDEHLEFSGQRQFKSRKGDQFSAGTVNPGDLTAFIALGEHFALLCPTFRTVLCRQASTINAPFRSTPLRLMRPAVIHSDELLPTIANYPTNALESCVGFTSSPRRRS